ncbi:hypothetical protein PN498_17795 [Oscillatoria sp. CS-180]|uniref:hypothetical protein n=1 Tax=Oscillatoria sp. CS-180 TaxID=3021720 RepID=UPI0023300E32|nr:hypothetical protein [Oscillatoria sp. CS-180]MDB9527853.1 hypothetical protein [Oscillatoria sp. CS-180]
MFVALDFFGNDFGRTGSRFIDLIDNAVDFWAIGGFAEEVGEYDGEVRFTLTVLLNHHVDVRLVAAVVALFEAIENADGR